MNEGFLKYGIIFLFAFVAELIDGGIGMGYGVSLTSFLISIGIGTAISSASVHISEIFTTLSSGLSHFKMGNFEKKTFLYLAIPGMVGGSLGAYVVSRVQDFGFIRPFVSGILLLLGILIVIKFLSKKDFVEQEYKVPRIRRLVPLGFTAAFIDAIGGGGWGPIATPTLIASNTHPRKTIGSVNLAEFFVTLSISITFLLTLPNLDWSLIFPMIIGGIIAAPVSALLTKKLPIKMVGIAVGFLIILLSFRMILGALRPFL